MNLYLHIVISHVPLYFETSDFKNALVERFEAFLAVVKKILLHSTSRDVSRQEPILEILTRHVYRQYAEPKRTKSLKMSQLFRKHIFPELSIVVSERNRQDVNSLVQNLVTLGYKEGEHWTRERLKITFCTAESVSRFRDSL